MNIFTTFWFAYGLVWIMVGFFNYLATPTPYHERERLEGEFYEMRSRYLNVSVINLIIAIILMLVTYE